MWGLSDSQGFGLERPRNSPNMKKLKWLELATPKLSKGLVQALQNLLCVLHCWSDCLVGTVQLQSGLLCTKVHHNHVDCAASPYLANHTQHVNPSCLNA